MAYTFYNKLLFTYSASVASHQDPFSLTKHGYVFKDLTLLL